VRSELVGSSVPGEKGDSPTGQGPDPHRGGGAAERCFDDDVLGVVGEVVEPRAPEDPDLGPELGGTRVEGDLHRGQSDVLGVADELVDELDAVPLSDFVVVALLDESDPDEAAVDESEPDPGGVVAFEPRLSVLKKPEPLNVTPTGWKTFLTASTSPDSGWVYSLSVSSVNPCWTSMVSPVSTNL
jgi:hypothetical protein